MAKSKVARDQQRREVVAPFAPATASHSAIARAKSTSSEKQRAIAAVCSPIG